VRRGTAPEGRAMSARPLRNFGFGSDEAMLRDLARKLLDERLPVERLRQLVAADPEAVYERGESPAWDPALWQEMVELGWTGLAVPERCGGAGFKRVGIAALVEEVGRHALPSPLLATLDASQVLCEVGGRSAEAWLGRIADGATASLAFAGPHGSWDPAEGELAAREDGSGLCLDGVAHFVQEAGKVDVLLAFARSGDGQALCVVRRDAGGLRLEHDRIHDLTRDQATAHFEGVRVAEEDVVSRDAAGALERAWPAILVNAAADLVGCAEWQLQTTVQYAKDRHQFDRPIGFFQAVKHPLVNAMIEIDRARSLVYHAACCIDEGDPGALGAARMAKSAASDAGAFVSDRSVQLHGGIGFTWECDVHLFFKRSLHGQALYGDGVHQRRELANLLIGPIGEGAAPAGA
jgi:alkylation response protein AidB-like acyl-CoA dehydrogenase